MYHLGEGMIADDVEAIEYFTKAAEQENDGAQEELDELNKKDGTIINWFKTKFNIDCCEHLLRY